MKVIVLLVVVLLVSSFGAYLGRSFQQSQSLVEAYRIWDLEEAIVIVESSNITEAQFLIDTFESYR